MLNHQIQPVHGGHDDYLPVDQFEPIHEGHNDLLPLDQVEPVQAYFQSAMPKKTAKLGHFFNYTFLFGKRLFLVGNT